MKTYGPLYGGQLKYWHRKPLPIVEVGTTNETEHPFREGKCLVFRAPFTHTALYVGLFTHNPNIQPDDDEAIDELLMKAMRARVDEKGAARVREV